MNLKYHYSTYLLILGFGLAIFFSFKHSPHVVPFDVTSATPEERLDQIKLSAMHADTLATSSSSRILPAIPASFNATATDLEQVRAFDEIIAAKNDNDSRLDTQLRHLSPAAKELLEGRYSALAPERRNARGTIAFLVGRDLSSGEDIKFLHAVISEPPCLSLKSCGHEETGSVAREDRHFEGTNEVSLAYPQLAALKQLEAFLNTPGHPQDLGAQALAEIETARISPVHKIASLADEIARKYHAIHP